MKINVICTVPNGNGMTSGVQNNNNTHQPSEVR